MSQKINDLEAANHQNIKFLLKLGDEDTEELISYVELNDIICQQMDDEEVNPNCPWVYKGILKHEGPLTSKSENWKGSTWNVKLQWEDGSQTWEPLNIIGKDDPITCAVYAKDHGLLETTGWKFLKKYA